MGRALGCLRLSAISARLVGVCAFVSCCPGHRPRRNIMATTRATPDTGPATAMPAADRGRVLLVRQDGGNWCLVNKVSRERVSLQRPDGVHVDACELAFDDEGFGTVILASAGHEESFLSCADAFSMQVFVAESTGQEFIDMQPEAEQPQLIGVEQYLAGHELVRIRCRHVGALRVEVMLEAAKFAVPKSDGCRLVVSLSDVVRALELDPAAKKTNTRGKWVHNMWPSWEGYISKLGGCGVLLKSQPYAKGSASELDSARVLPWLSCTWPALLALLLRFTGANRRTGALEDPRRQQACLDLLEALAKFACSHPWEMSLCFDPAASLPIYPAPREASNRAAALRAELGGRLLWPARPPTVPEPDWWAMCNGHDMSHPDSLVSFMRRTAGEAGRTWLLAQIVRLVGMQIESLVLETVEENGGGQHLVALLPPEATAHCTDVVLETRLMQYVQQAHDACKAFGPLHLSISGDSSRVGCFGILNGLAVLPNNIGFTMAPQAPIATFSPVSLGYVSGGRSSRTARRYHSLARGD